MAQDRFGPNFVCGAKRAARFRGAAAMNLPPPRDPRYALFLDVDGTLLDIAERPELVTVPPSLPPLLDRLAGEHDGAVAVVSGRKIEDIDRLFVPWRGPAAGLHGGERRRADGTVIPAADDESERAAREALDQLRPLVLEFAAKAPGIWLEDKGSTLAMHYRAAPQCAPEVLDLARKGLDASGGALRMIAGKMVVELQPKQFGKGGAVAAFLEEQPFCNRAPVFLGDDVTDEDGFTEVNRRGGMSIRVGPPAPPTAASFELPSVPAALAWLAGQPPA